MASSNFIFVCLVIGTNPTLRIRTGVYEVPAGIGRGAELVLQGCIERSTSSRWTIAMVDEVSWGVGWGVDDITSAANDEGFVNQNYAPHYALNSLLPVQQPLRVLLMT
jgi:hypothetical protein